MLVMGFIKNIDCSLLFHFDFNLISLTLLYRLIIFFDIRRIVILQQKFYVTYIGMTILSCKLCYSLDFPTLPIQPRFRDHKISSNMLLCLK